MACLIQKDIFENGKRIARAMRAGLAWTQLQPHYTCPVGVFVRIRSCRVDGGSRLRWLQEAHAGAEEGQRPGRCLPAGVTGAPSRTARSDTNSVQQARLKWTTKSGQSSKLKS